MGAQGSDEAWFEGLYRRAHGRVRGYVIRRCEPADVDDVVAETFAVVWRRRSERRRIDEPWLLRTASNLLLHQGRSTVRRARLLDRATSLDVATPDHADRVSDRYDAHRRIADALMLLSAADQEVLLLSAWDQLTPSEIGRVLGITAGAARVRLHRASTRLAAATQTSREWVGLPEVTP